MKNHKSILSISLMGLLLASGSAFAQEGNPNPVGIVVDALDNDPRERGAQMANTAAGTDVFSEEITGQVAAEAAAEDPSAMAIGRAVTEDTDPLTASAVKLLDETGIIGRQRALAEGMIIMDQNLAFVQKIESVLATLGPEAEVEVAPGVFQKFEGTPAALKAEIEMIKLQQDLVEAKAELSLAIAEASAPEGTVPTEPVDAAGLPRPVPVDPDTGAPLPVRDDGTGFQAMPGEDGVTAPVDMAQNAPAGQVDVGVDIIRQVESIMAEREAELRRMIEEFEAKTTQLEAEQAEMERASAGRILEEDVRMLEVIGSAGNYVAIIDLFGEVKEVQVGDMVDREYQVESITADSVTLRKGSASTTVRF